MPFIGNQPALSYTSFAKQDFTTSATTTYTLDNPVANANELALFINNVRQEPTTAYSANSNILTLTEATSVGDDMYCVYLGKAVQTVNPPNASVGTSQLVDGAVTSAKLGTNVGGKVLQAQTFVTNGNSSSTTSTSYVNTENTISITPISSNSKILDFADHTVAISNGSSNCRIDIRIHETTTSTSVTDKRYVGGDGTGGHSRLNYQFGLSGGFTNSSTAQKTFKVQVRKADGNTAETGNIFLNWYTNSLHTMMAIEVQA